jgi:hypothetical protein
MKPDQQRYARQRIAEAKGLKLTALREKHTKLGKTPGIKDMLKEIKYGNVELFRHATIEFKLKDAFDFSDLTPQKELNEKAYNKEAIVIERAASECLDEIMLGDEKKAIELIRKFCAK